MEQRAEALASLTETLAALEGADEGTVTETAERAGNRLVGQDFMTALFLNQITQVLADQQARIEALESRSASKTKTKK
jgi:hypothetical protein